MVEDIKRKEMKERKGKRKEGRRKENSWKILIGIVKKIMRLVGKMKENLRKMRRRLKESIGKNEIEWDFMGRIENKM